MNIIKRNLLAIAAFAVIGSANATTPGVYLGAGFGTAYLPTLSRAGYIGQLFAGYNFNQYFGLQSTLIGYEQYNYNYFGFSSSEHYTNAFSIVGKAYLPLGESRFNLYALGGMALVNNTVKYDSVNFFTGQHTRYNTTTRAVRPMYGVGASVDFTKHVSSNLEFSQINGSGSANSSVHATPTLNMLTLNLSYNF